MKPAIFVLIISAPVCMLLSCVSYPVKSSDKRGISWYKVEMVTSGDSILLNGVGRVKYIGVRAPKRSLSGKKDEKFWKESLEKNRELVEGKWVRLEFDRSRQDSSGRFLAYVFVQQDFSTEIFVNGEMLRLGMARLAESTVNLKYHRRLENLQNRARSNHSGIWSE